MSVLVSDRKESKFEAITFSVELHNMLIEFMQRNFGVKDLDHFVRMRFAYGKDQYIIQIIKSNLEKRTIIGILATIVLIRLMVSSSYMIEGLFYTVLGLLLNPYDMNRKYSNHKINDIKYYRINSNAICKNQE